MAKSLKKAYACWFFGGLFGLHHVYLGNDKKAFIYLITLGGFLFGSIRDILKIPEYVKKANEEKYYVEKSKKLQSQLKAPAFLDSSFFVCIIVSSIFGYMTFNCINEEEIETNYKMDFIMKSLSPFVVALIVYIAGTQPPYNCEFIWPLIGSYASIPLNMIKGVPGYLNMSIISSLFLNWNVEWDRYDNLNKKKRKAIKRFFWFTLRAAFIAFIVSLYLWNNASFEKDGEKVTLKESILNFLNSKEINQLTEIVRVMWNFYQAHGLKKLFNKLYYGYDPAEIARAYEIIGENDKISQQELDSKCKLLSRKWHPDKFKEIETKLEAEKKFMDIQQSCNLLSDHRKKKFNQNQKSEE